MKSVQNYRGIIVLLLVFSYTIAKREFTIEIMDARFEVLDTEFVKYFNYKVYGRKMIYADLEFHKKVNEFDIKLNFDIVKKDKSHISLIQIVTDGCESLEKAQKIKLLKALFQEVLRVSNLPKKCPLLANNAYVFKNYTLKDEDYPAILPITEWQLRAELIVHKKCRGNLTINGRVRRV